MAVFIGTNDADSITGAGSSGSIPALTPNEADVVFGNGGNDTVIGHVNNPSALFALGGDGDDSVVGGGGGAPLGAGTNTVLRGEGGNDTLVAGVNAFNTLLDGGSRHDSLIGSAQGDVLLGGSGNDHLRGDGGSDTADGGTGANVIEGGAGADLILVTFSNGGNHLFGNADTDTIIGSAGNDTIEGGEGFDSIDGGDGTNSISGGEEGDRITAGLGNDFILGGAGDDRIEAGEGANLVGGEDGNDYLTAGFGEDSLFGGAGNDHIFASGGGPTGGLANLLMGEAGDDSLLATFGADSIDGGSGNDHIEAGSGVNTVTGGDGADTINAGDGADTLSGGAGNDLINAGSGDDTLAGEAGEDTLRGGAGADEFRAERGNDSLDGGAGEDRLTYGDFAGELIYLLHLAEQRVVMREAGEVVGVDTIEGFESYLGGGGQDRFAGSGRDETFTGGAGNDVIDGGGGIDTAIWEGAAPLIVSLVTGIAIQGTFVDRLRREAPGDNSIEVIFAGSGSDVLRGDADDNMFRGGDGADTLDGGTGRDIADYLRDGIGPTEGIFANLSEVARGNVAAGHIADGWGRIDRVINIEGVRGSGERDLLFGSAADNLLIGMSGDDHINGGAGRDTASYRQDNDSNGDGFGVVVNLTGLTIDVAFAGAASLSMLPRWARDGWSGTDSLIEIEIVLGSAHRDLLVGMAAADGAQVMLSGGLGADTLQGMGAGAVASYADDASGILADLGGASASGGFMLRRVTDGAGFEDILLDITAVEGSAHDDRIIAAAGGSWMRGGAGNDTLTGGAGADTIDHGDAVAAASVNLLAGTALDGHGGADSLGGIEAVVGSAFADTLLGGNGAETLLGAGGADQLRGGAGHDSLLGDAGADLLDGGVGNDGMAGGGGNDLYLVDSRFDTVTEAAGGGADTVQASNSFGLAAGSEVEALILTGGAWLIGSDTDNLLIGNARGNQLNGGAGADTLVGGGGADTLTGGAGADRFLYNAVPDSHRASIDHISDLTPGLDSIALEDAAGALFAGLAPTAISFNGAVTVAAANLGAGATAYAAVLSGFAAALGGQAAVTASTATLQVWQIDVATGSAAGRYLFVNDGTAGTSVVADLLIGVGATSSTPLAAPDVILA